MTAEHEAAYQALIDRSTNYIEKEVDWSMLADRELRQRHLMLCLTGFALAETRRNIDAFDGKVRSLIAKA